MIAASKGFQEYLRAGLFLKLFYLRADRRGRAPGAIGCLGEAAQFHADRQTARPSSASNSLLFFSKK
jgi:hypothetical protein